MKKGGITLLFVTRKLYSVPVGEFQIGKPHMKPTVESFPIALNTPYIVQQMDKVSFTINYKYCDTGPPLWSSGQSSWLQIRRPGFDSWHYQKKNVMGLERGALSLVSTN
jgi:hypothetical protein